LAAVILLVAGGLSYLASASPDGLDSATLRGCQAVPHDGGKILAGQCIAQHSTDRRLAASPFADYAVQGRPGTVGAAGLVGVGVTIAIAGGLFWLIARRRSEPAADPSTRR